MIYIRADMNDIIAAGHIMRCLAIADAIRALGGDVTFLLADENAVPLLADRGYRYIVLHSKWNDLEGEISKLLSLIDTYEEKTLLIDHYYVTERYLSELREHFFTVYLDDLNAFLYPVDMLICAANYFENYKYEKRYGNTNTKLLLGTRYATLRKAFQKRSEKIIRDKISSLLIMSGGSDSYSVVRRLLERLDIKLYKNIYAVCGIYNDDFDMLSNRHYAYPQVKILKFVPDIDKYMDSADVAISAGGTTLYELCAIGTPAISYTVADNQRPNVRKFQEDGIIPYAGDMRDIGTMERILEILNGELQEKSLRTSISHRMQTVVDGNGAARLAKAILEHSAE